MRDAATPPAFDRDTVKEQAMVFPWNRRLFIALSIGCAWLCACSQTPSGADNAPAGVISCSRVRAASSGSSTVFCVETAGLTTAQAMGNKGACEAEDGGADTWTFTDQPCPRDGALGGCQATTRTSQTITTTQWFYVSSELSAATADAGAVSCVAGQVFVTP
jgi:hypothetical protein